MDSRTTTPKSLVDAFGAWIAAFASFLLAITMTGCSDRPDDPTPRAMSIDGPVHVVANLPPYASLVSMIGGDSVRVHTLRAAGDTTHGTWKPTDDDYKALDAAHLIVVLGPAFDGWLSFTSLPESSVLHLAESIKGDEVLIEDEAPHRHGMGAAHSHYVLDPHIWFDPLLFMKHAAAITDALADRLPKHAALFRGRLEQIRGRLQAVHETLKTVVWPKNTAVYSLSPAYRYLAKRYGWTWNLLATDREQRSKQLQATTPAVVVVDPSAERIAADGKSLLMRSMPSPTTNTDIVTFLEHAADQWVEASKRS